MKNLAQLADNLPRKMKKEDVQLLIRTMYEETQDERLAHLYNYFMPTMPKKPRNIFQWVAQAIGKDQTRHYLFKVYSDGENIVATDGNIALIAPDGRPEGFYCPITEEYLPDYYANFPDYKRIIPSDGDKFLLETELIELSGDRGAGYKMKDSEFVYDKRLLDKCLSYGDPISCQGSSPMRLDFKDGCIAVIMPIRM